MNDTDVMAIQLVILFAYFLFILLMAFPLIATLDDDLKRTQTFVKRLFKLTWIWLFLFIGSSLLYIFI